MKATIGIIEKLAALEHEQWISWSKEIALREKLSGDRLALWMALWKPYSELTEEQKTSDREWALKAFKIMNEGKTP